MPRKPAEPPAPQPVAASSNDRLLSTAEVCALIGGIDRTTLWRWERAKKFPPRARIEGLVRWWESEVMAHLRSLPRGMA